MGYHSFVPVQLVIASFYLPLVLRVLLPAALLLQRREPSMQKSCGVLGWPSLIHVPSSFMQEWTSAFSEALLRLSRFPLWRTGHTYSAQRSFFSPPLLMEASSVSTLQSGSSARDSANGTVENWPPYLKMFEFLGPRSPISETRFHYQQTCWHKVSHHKRLDEFVSLLHLGASPKRASYYVHEALLLTPLTPGPTLRAFFHSRSKMSPRALVTLEAMTRLKLRLFLNVPLQTWRQDLPGYVLTISKLRYYYQTRAL